MPEISAARVAALGPRLIFGAAGLQLDGPAAPPVVVREPGSDFADGED